MSAFHRWLLKHRPYCEIGSCMIPSTRVAKIDNRNTCVCDSHWRAYNPLRAGYERKVEIYYDSKNHER